MGKNNNTISLKYQGGGGGGHFISYSGRVFTATPDDDMERVYEEPK